MATIDVITASVSSSTVFVDEINTLSYTYLRGDSVTVTLYMPLGSRVWEIKTIQATSSPVTLQISEDESFVRYRSTLNETRIIVEVYGAYDARTSVEYRLKRQPLVAWVSGKTDPDTLEKYIETGYQFDLNFEYRLGRSITCVMFTNNDSPFGYHNLYKADGSPSYVFNQDQVLIDCLKRWFDDAQNSTTTSMVITINCQDEKYRTARITIELRAGPDMKPIVIFGLQPVQKSGWPTVLSNYYVQGYSNAKFEANVTLPTIAIVKTVSITSNQIGTAYMQLNSETGKYEATTQSPLTTNTTYEITVEDSRGLATSSGAQTITVIPYNYPNISIQNYHRWVLEYTYVQSTAATVWSITHNLNKNPTVVVVNGNGDIVPCDVQYTDSNNLTCTFSSATSGTAYLGTSNDLGEYCLMSVYYVFSPINNLNEKDTEVEVVGVQAPEPDERTLSAYTSTETYFFAADIEHSYTIHITATDLLNSQTLSVTLSTAGVIMDFLSGGKGIGLGKVAETSRMVEVNPEWKLQAEQIFTRVKNSDGTVDLGIQNLSTFLYQLKKRLDEGGL